MDRWTELANAARDGDRNALEAFVRVSQDDVRRLCRHLGDPDSVDDLVQETYGRALRSLPRFRSDGTARSWLLAIARNTCADATRRRIRRRRHMADRPAPEATVGHGSWVEVAELVAALDPDRREAFVLTQFVGLSYHDAADVLGCPVGTIRSRVARARADLLRTFGDANGLADEA